MTGIDIHGTSQNESEEVVKIGSLRRITKYEYQRKVNTFEKLTTDETSIMTHLELILKGTEKSFPFVFNGYVGRELLGLEVTYREEREKRKNKDSEQTFVVQSLTPTNDILPIYTSSLRVFNNQYSTS